MGLTVSCARCHDHKFDPIPTQDYYALHGVFASSEEPAEKPLLGPWRFAGLSGLPEAEGGDRRGDGGVQGQGNGQVPRLNSAQNVGDYLLAGA